MSLNLHNGFCNSICSHPSCWNYHRNLLRNSINIIDNFSKKTVPIEIPHQSILNLNSKSLPSVKSDKAVSNPQLNKTNNDLYEYLISKKKVSKPYLNHRINSSFLKELTNTNNGPLKLAQLDVHEIFDLEELQSDWKKTFKSKDVYVWIPCPTIEQGLKTKKESNKMARSIKTPVLQLAPVLENQLNSSRRNTSSLSNESDMFYKIPSSSLKKTPKKIIKKKPEDNHISFRGSENCKENIHCKSLEETLHPQKMQIHNITDRGLNRSEFISNNQIYVMDSLNFNYPFDKFLYNQNRNTGDSSEMNTSGLKQMKLSKKPPYNYKNISIISSNLVDDGLDLRLGPQKLRHPSSLISYRSEISQNSKPNDHSSMGDSMLTNALSDRSTLNDPDLLPGNSMLQILKTSYQLVKERTEEIGKEIIVKQIVQYKDIKEQPKLNASYQRSTKSASENLASAVIPSPPPPSPEMSQRFRSISAAADLHRVQPEI